MSSTVALSVAGRNGSRRNINSVAPVDVRRGNVASLVVSVGSVTDRRPGVVPFGDTPSASSLSSATNDLAEVGSAPFGSRSSVDNAKSLIRTYEDRISVAIVRDSVAKSMSEEDIDFLVPELWTELGNCINVVELLKHTINQQKQAISEMGASILSKAEATEIREVLDFVHSSAYLLSNLMYGEVQKRGFLSMEPILTLTPSGLKKAGVYSFRCNFADSCLSAVFDCLDDDVVAAHTKKKSRRCFSAIRRVGGVDGGTKEKNKMNAPDFRQHLWESCHLNKTFTQAFNQQKTQLSYHIRQVTSKVDVAFFIITVLSSFLVGCLNSLVCGLFLLDAWFQKYRDEEENTNLNLAARRLYRAVTIGYEQHDDYRCSMLPIIGGVYFYRNVGRKTRPFVVYKPDGGTKKVGFHGMEKLIFSEEGKNLLHLKETFDITELHEEVLIHLVVFKCLVRDFPKNVLLSGTDHSLVLMPVSPAPKEGSTSNKGFSSLDIAWFVSRRSVLKQQRRAQKRVPLEERASRFWFEEPQTFVEGSVSRRNDTQPDLASFRNEGNEMAIMCDALSDEESQPLSSGCMENDEDSMSDSVGV